MFFLEINLDVNPIDTDSFNVYLKIVVLVWWF
jgi:hypothetical protein